MRNKRILALASTAWLLTGCASWRWSGHPAGMIESSPSRAGSGGHDARSRGVTLHGTGGKQSFAISADAVKAAAPFLAGVPRTPGEHMEAGRAYLDKAEQHRREAASHYAMKRLYGEKDPDMAAHCDRLIEQLSALAAQYEDISILHERTAEELKQPGK